jgi:hypothetical protein
VDVAVHDEDVLQPLLALLLPRYGLSHVGSPSISGCYLNRAAFFNVSFKPNPGYFARCTGFATALRLVTSIA